MPRYRLDRPEGGTITLPSGTWHWFPVRLMALPENACVRQSLIFGHAQSTGSTMRRRLEPDVLELRDGQLLEFALAPDERTLVLDGHQFRIEPPLEAQLEPMWRVHGPTSQQRFETDWEVEMQLGELTEQDMMAIVRSGP